MSTAPLEIVVAGHLCLDVIPAFPDKGAPLSSILQPGRLIEVGAPLLSAGGAVSNTGLALHALGVRTRLVGRVGDDLFGTALLGLLERRDPVLASGLFVRSGVPTSYTVVMSPPGVDRIFLHCPGANDALRPDEIDLTLLADARVVHFGYPPLMRQTYVDGGQGLGRLFEALRARGQLVSLDMAQPDPASEAGRVDWTAWMAEVLPHVDLFAPSLDEICFMLGIPLSEQAPLDLALLDAVADRLVALGARIVALKLGDAGLYLRTSDEPEAMRTALAGLDPPSWLGRQLLAPCFRVHVAGTTGSGDATIAGLLAALVRGLGAEEAVTMGVAVGACSVEQPDASSGIPPWAAVEKRLRGGWEPCREPWLDGPWPGAGGPPWRGPRDRRPAPAP